MIIQEMMRYKIFLCHKVFVKKIFWISWMRFWPRKVVPLVRLCFWTKKVVPSGLVVLLSQTSCFFWLSCASEPKKYFLLVWLRFWTKQVVSYGLVWLAYLLPPAGRGLEILLLRGNQLDEKGIPLHTEQGDQDRSD